MDARKKSGKSEKPKKESKKDGLQIKPNVTAQEDWLRRVGGSRTAHNLSDLLGRHPFRNTLPEPPMDPKFLKQSSELLMKQIEYKTTSIESRYKYPILTEPDLGVTVNLIDPSAYHFYEENEMPALHPEDKFLVDLQVDPPGAKKRHERPRPRVAWLRKTEYMSNDLYEPAQKFKSQHDTMLTFREQAKRKDIEAGKTLDERIEDIENTFRKAKEAPVHHANKRLVAKKVLPVLPFSDFWSNQYTAITFDDNQYSASGHTKADSRQGILKAAKNKMPNGEEQKFIGYMLPSKRKRAEADTTKPTEAVESEEAVDPTEDTGISEFDWVRNYTFNHEDQEGEKTIILVENETNNVLYYVMQKSKLALHRVTHTNQYKPSRVDVSRREFKSHERNARGRRKREGLKIDYETEPEEEENVEEPVHMPTDADANADGTEAKEGQTDMEMREDEVEGGEGKAAYEQAEEDVEHAVSRGEPERHDNSTAKIDSDDDDDDV